MDTNGPEPLRLGILIDGWQNPAWVCDMLARIKASSDTTIALVVLNRASPPARRSLVSRLWENRRQLLYHLYRRIDRRLFRATPDAFAMRDVSSLLHGIPCLEVKPRQRRYSDWIEDGDIETIGSHRLDVLIRLGFRILRGKILQSARCGVWSFHHGDNRVNRGGPAGFWEVFEGHAVTGSILQKLNEDLDNGEVICRSYSATDIISVNRNCNNFYWKTLSFVPRQLATLRRRGPVEFLAAVRSANRHPNWYSSRLYKVPSNSEFCRLAVRLVIRYLRLRALEQLFDEQWVLYWAWHGGANGSLWKFGLLVPPPDRFWADPHVIQAGTRHYIFIEEFCVSAKKAHIAVMRVDDGGAPGPPIKILERPYHLSYPFVFEYGAAFYMIPETSANRTIEVYRAIAFPEKWELHKVLMNDLQAVDTTLLFHNQRWWLFTNIAENKGSSTFDELFLFYADSPLSDTWTPHPLNPIVSDVRSARPAGPIFACNDSLYRPSQDNSRGYGSAMQLNEIQVLSETDYREGVVDEIRPRWAERLTGVHSFAQAAGLTVWDARRQRFRGIQWRVARWRARRRGGWQPLQRLEGQNEPGPPS